MSNLIINPNATIALGAPLPSAPDKMPSYSLPADPAVQGVATFDTTTLGLVVWVLTMRAIIYAQRIDRLERLVAQLVCPGRSIEEIGASAVEDAALGDALGAEVRARRSAEAKARAEQAAEGGVQ